MVVWLDKRMDKSNSFECDNNSVYENKFYTVTFLMTSNDESCFCQNISTAALLKKHI